MPATQGEAGQPGQQQAHRRQDGDGGRGCRVGEVL